MSNSKHSSRYANAALVMTLGPEAFAAYGRDAFAGVALQRALETRFFEAGGETYAAPAQRVPDFLQGRESAGELRTSYGFGVVPGRIDLLLPLPVRAALAQAFGAFERQIRGFAGPDGILVGIETRSSGPVRAPRDRVTRVAVGFQNLFPIGEGAGHAGGITSAAIDGAHAGHEASGAAPRV